MWESGSLTLSGRFDIGINVRNVKMFEFNSDSAGTYSEAGLIQGKWAKAVGCDVGVSAGEDLENFLIEQAKEVLSGLVHLMIENDQEEIHNTTYIQEIFTKAGLESKIVLDLNFKRSPDGGFVDNDGVPIKTVWKMWNWETIIADYSKPRVEDNVKLSDIFLDPNIRVFEPIWKVVTSNKALLPILWELYPNHPYLLRTEWNLENFAGKPYVKKPIVGRCGQNVQIVSPDGEKIEECVGNYGNRDFIYQEVFDIQKFDGFHPVIGGWVVGRRAAGFGIREDTKLITDHHSPFGCCRIVD